MSPRWNSARVRCALAVVCTVLLSAGIPSGLDAGSGRPAVLKDLNAFDSAAVERARTGAVRKLQDPQCLTLLTDFHDREGRTLDRNLEAWGVSAAEYVQTLPFRDGAALPGCLRREVHLQTSPGRPPVFVCPAGTGALNSRFAQVQVHDPSFAEAMVIHEMLHTLGLGENPPTSLEITERVRARCR